jgi:hypothetical protein
MHQTPDAIRQSNRSTPRFAPSLRARQFQRPATKTITANAANEV